MTITYEEALSTLQSMFSSQGYTTQQLDAVLRHHGGHMEHTVETILGHGEGAPDELMAKLKDIPVGGTAAAPRNAGGISGSAGVDADEELARQLAAEEDGEERPVGASGRSRGAGGGGGAGGAGGSVGLGGGILNAHPRWSAPPGQRRSPTAHSPSHSTNQSSMQSSSPRTQPTRGAAPVQTVQKGRGTPTILPPDFLRIPGRKYPSSSSNPVANAAGGTVMMTDEQLARMLQDELFQEELRNNPEFSHLAGRRNPRAGLSAGGGGYGHATGRSTYSGAGGGGAWGAGGGSGGAGDFFERLSELGDNAKRRFQELAASWGDTNRNQPSRGSAMGGMGFGGMGGGGAGAGAGSRTNERRGLLSGDLNLDEEEEMNFVGSGGGGGEFVELGDVRGGSGGAGGGSGDKKKD